MLLVKQSYASENLFPFDVFKGRTLRRSPLGEILLKDKNGRYSSERQSLVLNLHTKALKAVKVLKSSEMHVIECLDQAERFKIFYDLKFSSLFDYATKGLGLDPNLAYTYIGVTRKSREVPALKEEIKRGNITLFKAKKIVPVLTQENQEHWLELAKTASKQKIEREVAAANPKAAVPETMTYTTAQIDEKTKFITLPLLPGSAIEGLKNKSEEKLRIQLQVGLSEIAMIKLRRAQNVLSQKRKKAVSLEELLETMTDLFLEKSDPLRKAERQLIRGKLVEPTERSVVFVENTEKNSSDDRDKGFSSTSKNQLVPGPVNVDGASRCKVEMLAENLKVPKGTNRRKPIDAKTKHQVFLKYKGQCAFVDKDGNRCRSERHLETHHIKLVSEGGSNDLSNLQLLCWGHHRAQH